MQSTATTVEAYLAELPEDRRAALSAVRRVILDNLSGGYVEAMGYGMIGYVVPHSVYPAGYRADPKKPLPYVSLASQKNYMAVYLMGVYGSPELDAWFRAAWADRVAAGRAKRLDMGKACVRFKRLDDIPLDVIGEVIARLPAPAFIAQVEAALSGR